jgi:hypothetical protein
LIFQLIILVEKLKELIIEWGSTDDLLRIVYLDIDVSALYNQWKNALFVHEYVAHTDGIYRP